MPDKQYFEGIDVVSGGETVLSVDIADAEAREDLTDLENYVTAMTPVSLNVTRNGEYTAPTGVFGYSPITVNVPGGGGGATIEQLNVTANGTYAATASVDGYAPVIVNVPTNGALTGLITFFGMFKNEQYIGTPTI